MKDKTIIKLAGLALCAAAAILGIADNDTHPQLCGGHNHGIPYIHCEDSAYVSVYKCEQQHNTHKRNNEGEEDILPNIYSPMFGIHPLRSVHPLKDLSPFSLMDD